MIKGVRDDDDYDDEDDDYDDDEDDDYDDDDDDDDDNGDVNMSLVFYKNHNNCNDITPPRQQHNNTTTPLHQQHHVSMSSSSVKTKLGLLREGLVTMAALMSSESYRSQLSVFKEISRVISQQFDWCCSGVLWLLSSDYHILLFTATSSIINKN